jgi:hypothetical protein
MTKGFTMAQKVQVMLVDDVDGSEASESVSFGSDGTTYELDLSEKNAKKLGDELKAVRAWAASNKIELSTRGRVPARVIEQ